MSEFTLEELAATVAARSRSRDPASYTARLIAGGPPLCARKLGEEAVEAVVAAVAGDRAALKAEAADLLYHLLVLLEASGVPFAEVKAELARRTAQSGLEEKAGRSASA